MTLTLIRRWKSATVRHADDPAAYRTQIDE